MRNDQSTFIEEIISAIPEPGRVDYSGIGLILPTRRSVLYAKEYLARKSPGDIILPRISSFEVLVNSVTGLDIISTDESLLHLHSVFSDVGRKYSFSFSDFMDFSMMLLRDFDQIDHNLVDGKEIYRMLSASESLERWAAELDSGEAVSFDQSGMMSDYFTFWEICSEVYFLLKQNLLDSGKAYQGLAYRYFVENFDRLNADLKFEKIIFAGFNYLSGAQLKILELLKGTVDTHFSWDIDTYFLDRHYHEAGRYLRSYQKFDPISGDDFLQSKGFPDLRIQSCPNKNAQVKKSVDDILEILSTLDYETEIKDRKDLIALIPADESLLRIILESFPESFEDKKGRKVEIAPLLNISMGRKLSESQFTTLLHLFFDLQDVLKRDAGKIPYRFIRSIFVHPLIQSVIHAPGELDTLDTRVRKDNSAYLNVEELCLSEKDQALAEMLFKSWRGEKNGLINSCISVINYILEEGSDLPEDEKIFLSFFRNVFRRLEPLFTQMAKDLELKEYRKLLMQLIRQYAIPFSGEPISPVQIMGLLETRSLDFEHAFILSCNEGDLPSRRVQDSLFPFEIRKQFGIPTFLDKDASLAYTFYRLFYRSSSIHLYYHNASEGMGGKASPSRFVRQLQMELMPDFKLSHTPETLIHHFPKNSDPIQDIAKSEAILEKVLTFLKGEDKEGHIKYGLSPSMINTYLRNPLEFFQKAVLRIREADELEEGFAASTFGSIIHEVLEDLFTPYINQNIDENVLQEISKKTDLKKALINKTRELAGNIRVDEGINRLYLHSAEFLISKYLKLLRKDPFHLLKLETALNYQYRFYHEGLGREIAVTLTGKADRIDRQGNVIRIVDYKTGNYSKETIKMRFFDQLWDEEQRDKLLQLLIYKYLVVKNRDALFPGFTGLEVRPGFYFFRKGQQTFMELSMPDDMPDEAFCIAVESLIERIVRHMLDKDIPFESEIEGDIFSLIQ